VRATSVLALAVIFGASSVRAADGAGATGTADEALAAEAKKHYEEGTKAFNLAEFARAVAEFKIAYNAKPDPLLLYNIGQAFRLAGDDGQALLFYRSFLRNMPDAPNRREVEGRIRTLEKRVAEQKAAGQNQSASASRNKEAGVLASAPVPTSRAPADAVATPPEVSPPPPAAMVPQATRQAPAGARPLASQPTPGSGDATATTAAAPTAELGLAAARPATATASERQADISMAPTPAVRDGGGNDDKPIYKKWWFWAGVAAVALVGIAVAGNANKAPSTTLGLYQPTFK